jgi:hypothetical protein
MLRRRAIEIIGFHRAKLSKLAILDGTASDPRTAAQGKTQPQISNPVIERR